MIDMGLISEVNSHIHKTLAYFESYDFINAFDTIKHIAYLGNQYLST
jgi:hypothetical protein